MTPIKIQYAFLKKGQSHGSLKPKLARLQINSKSGFSPVTVLLSPMYDWYLFNYPYTIKEGKLYQLIENGTTGNWELHISELKGF